MTHEFLNFIMALAIIIVAAKLSGYISTRLGQPSVLGELIAGLLLGPTLLDFLHVWPSFSEDAHLGETITMLAELGVMLLMMLAGLELDLSDLLKAGKVSAVSGVLGVIVPFAAGVGTALLFGTGFNESLMIGLALSATSVSISAQTLIELGVLRSRVGLALLGAAVFDDILVILLLSVSAIVVGTAVGETSIPLTILRMAGYLVGASLIGAYILPWLTNRIERLPISQGLIAFAVVAVLLYGWAAEVLGGMAAITGAFLVGLFLARTPHKHNIEHGIAALSYGFFVPIFFVNIGLEVNLAAISGNAWWFAGVLTIVAILSKIIGSGGGALITGLPRKEALQLGIGMVSRGEVGLIVASFARSLNLISADDFAIIVFMVIIATLVTPPMLRAVFANQSSKVSTQTANS